jgi:hypothetical protein
VTEIRANSVQVDKLFRARCHLHPCGWMGAEHQTFAGANAERQAHITHHRLAADDAGPEVTGGAGAGFPVVPAGQIAGEVAGDVRQLACPPVIAACGRCGKPVGQPGVPRRDGTPAARALFCDACLDRCHEATDFAHVCQVCASPDEARQRGWAVTL